MDSAGLADLDLSRLEIVKGNFVITHSRLSRLNLPALKFIGQELGVSGNPELEDLIIPKLENVSSIVIGDNHFSARTLDPPLT